MRYRIRSPGVFTDVSETLPKGETPCI